MQDNPLRNVPVQETDRGRRYKQFRDELSKELDGMTTASQEAALKMNRDFIRGLNDPAYRESYMKDLEKALTPSSVHTDRALTALSVMYANDEYIGERLMPAVTVSKRSDVYYTYPKRERLASPDDRIGHRADSNEIEESRGTENYSVRDYGLKNYLDLEVVENEDRPLNEMVDLVESINELMAFNREKRILSIVSTAGNYAGNTAGAATQWDDTNAPAGGTIVADLLGATSSLWSGPNRTQKIGFTPITVWNQGIAANPALLDMYKHTQPGLITKAIAGQFQLDDILLVRAREDTANIGQSASYARMLTADVFGVVSVATRPTVRSAHFGSTFRMRNDPFTTQWFEPRVGKRGGIYARVAVSEDHKVVAGDTGFLITACLS